MKSSKRKFLCSKAHHLDSILFIGKNGIANGTLNAINNALDRHELIKIKFLDFKNKKHKLSSTIAKLTKSEIVANIGHVLILYRNNPNLTQRKIQISE